MSTKHEKNIQIGDTKEGRTTRTTLLFKIHSNSPQKPNFLEFLLRVREKPAGPFPVAWLIGFQGNSLCVRFPVTFSTKTLRGHGRVRYQAAL